MEADEQMLLTSSANGDGIKYVMCGNINIFFTSSASVDAINVAPFYPIYPVPSGFLSS